MTCEKKEGNSPERITENQSNLKPLTLDPDEYRKDLATFNLTEEQENELLQALWNIMSIMVDIGWGVDTVQILLPELFESANGDSVKLLDSENKQGETGH